MTKHCTVVISGKRFSGKSTLTNALLRRLEAFQNYTATEISFAEPIYRMHDHCLAILKDYGIQPAHEKKDRTLLQLLGTEWGRSVQGHDVWLKIARNRIEKFHALAGAREQNSVAILSDCRFKNEFHTFVDAPNSLSIRLNCDHDIRLSRRNSVDTDLNETHRSETDLDQYATDNKFSMSFDTGTESVDHMQNLVMAQILKLGYGY